jgi:hypothetical protein
MTITNWRTRIEDKLAWKKIVEQAKTHPGLYSWLRRRRNASMRMHTSTRPGTHMYARASMHTQTKK